MARSVRVKGSRVSDLRGIKELTIGALAAEAHISERTISSMEAGENIRRDVVAKVAQVLGVPTDELIDKNPQEDPGHDPYEWAHTELVKLIHRVERDDGRTEDLRIIATGFSGSVADLRLNELLERNIRIQILLMNPDNEVLMTARHGKRYDENPAAAADVVRAHIKTLEFTKKEVFKKNKGCDGALDWRLSDAMPFSFIVHSSKWALVSVFLARYTFARGPIIEIDHETALWETLLEDWNERWGDADPKNKRPYVPRVIPPPPEGFDEFFGDGASQHAKDAVIVLQSDPVEAFLAPFIADPEQTIKSAPPHRLYKARNWVNRCDTEGAKAIQEEFQKYRLNAPALLLSEHKSRDDIPATAPFQIAMGLGFTDRTKVAFKVCEPWMRVTREQDSGDAVSFHNALMPRGRLSRFAPPAQSEEAKFFRLLPLGWDATYLDRWLRSSKDLNSSGDVQDYAMILRHTLNDDPRQVIFALAGFTERATAVAGKYLAKNWPDLWRRYVADRSTGPSRGDFLIMIAGPSWQTTAEAWKEDTNFPAITPDRLRDLQTEDLQKELACEWIRRMDFS